jgi:signal transduction histidine kinase
MSKHGLTVELSITCDAVTFPEDRTELLYKSIRELLMNVVKHTRIDWAKVAMHVDAGNILVISVQDWGQGFDTSFASGNGTSAHFGLMHIRERMTMMGGWCQVHSTVGHGTAITLGLPLHLQSGSDALRDARAPQPDRVKARPHEVPTQARLRLE